MSFQVSDFKDKLFLDLLDFNFIESLYIRGSPQIKHFGYLNSLCARAMRAITNYTPISEYCLRFFPRKDFSCLCGKYPIESRCHVFYEYKMLNNYQNLKRDTISQFVSFLEYNLNAFSKEEVITQQKWLPLF